MRWDLENKICVIIVKVQNNKLESLLYTQLPFFLFTSSIPTLKLKDQQHTLLIFFYLIRSNWFDYLDILIIWKNCFITNALN